MTNCRATFRRAILRLALRLEHVLAVTYPCRRPSNGLGRCSIAGASGSRAALDGLRQATRPGPGLRVLRDSRSRKRSGPGLQPGTPSNPAFGQNVICATESAAAQELAGKSTPCRRAPVLRPAVPSNERRAGGGCGRGRAFSRENSGSGSSRVVRMPQGALVCASPELDRRYCRAPPLRPRGKGPGSSVGRANGVAAHGGS